MARKTNPFAPRTSRKPRSQLSQNPISKRHRRISRSKFGLQAAFARASTNCRTRKTRGRQRLIKADDWGLITKEEQEARVRDVEQKEDLKLEQEIRDLRMQWSAKTGDGNDGYDTGEEDDDDDTDYEVGSDLNDSDLDSDSEGSDMEDGLVDADAAEQLFDEHGNVLTEQRLEDLVKKRVLVSENRVNKALEKYENIGSFEEEPWDSDDEREKEENIESEDEGGDMSQL